MRSLESVYMESVEKTFRGRRCLPAGLQSLVSLESVYMESMQSLESLESVYMESMEKMFRGRRFLPHRRSRCRTFGSSRAVS